MIVLLIVLLDRFDAQQHITFLHNLSIFANEGKHTSCYFSLNLVEDLHGFYQGNYLSNMDNVTNSNKGGCCGRSCRIVDTGERRNNGYALRISLFAASRLNLKGTGVSLSR